MAHSYLLLSPNILTDEMFFNYGGQTGSSTAAQRSNAYLMAESLVTEHLGTPLISAPVTGTYQPQLAILSGKYLLDHAYVTKINSVTFREISSTQTWTIQETSGCSVIIQGQWGIVDLFAVRSICNCGNMLGSYLVEVIYDAGLSTGVS